MAKSFAGSSLLFSAWGAQAFAPQPQLRSTIAHGAAQPAGREAINEPVLTQESQSGEPSTMAALAVGCTALAAAGLARRQRIGESKSSSVVRCAYDASKELGACSPLGYWDPFGLMAFQDKAKFDRNRELELKHGRVSMVAIIGITFPDLFGKFDGYLSPSAGLKFADIPSSIQAIYKVPLEGWLQILAFAGLLEARNIFFPTNYGYPPFLGQIGKLSEEARQQKLLAELNNGRLAMIAIAATVAQNGATGQTLIEQFTNANLNPWIGGYAVPHGHSRTALRAVQDYSQALPWASVPEGLTNKSTGTQYIGDVGFDPAGFATNRRLLPWYREAELAHGRVCMLATLGYTVQSAGGKWEPFITRFPTSSDDPLLAATQVPFVGWLQILVVIGLSELWRYENVISKYDNGVKPGDLGWNVKAPVDGPRPKWFGPTFSAGYSKADFELMQLREIKHCRLAMFGFFFMVIENANGVKNVGLIPNFELPEYAAAVGDFIPKNL